MKWDKFKTYYLFYWFICTIFPQIYWLVDKIVLIIITIQTKTQYQRKSWEVWSEAQELRIHDMSNALSFYSMKIWKIPKQLIELDQLFDANKNSDKTKQFIKIFMCLTTKLTFTLFWQTIKAFLPDMMAKSRVPGQKGYGHLVTVASIAGLSGSVRLADYCASKFAAVGLEESLRLELQCEGYNGIHSTVVCPFFISTGMFAGVDSRYE